MAKTGQESQADVLQDKADRNSPQSAPKHRAPAAVEAEGGNVEKIRDILFGTQMHDYEERFVQLEERVIKETADLRDETRKLLDSLERLLKSEVAALGEKLQKEQGMRADSHQEILKELQERSASFESEMGRVEVQLTQNSSELRDQILVQSTKVSEDLGRRQKEASAAMEEMTRELQATKVDHKVLGEIFSEIGIRLTKSREPDLGPESVEEENG